MQNEMGVTDNARLLLGHIAGAMAQAGRGELAYDVGSIDAAGGSQVVRHVGSLNAYRIPVVQIEGIE